MKIATWNVNSLKVRLPQVIDWLANSEADVLCLQELKQEDAAFPAAELAQVGYHAAWYGQKTYNGVAILTRAPLIPSDINYGIPGYEDPQRRVISATVDGIRIVCAYFVNGEALDSPKFSYKLEWLTALHGYMAETVAQHVQVALLGDFNIAPDDRDVYDPAAWHERVLCSTPERAAFQGLLQLGLHDSLRHFDDAAQRYTWWDYRQMMFRRNLGLRIDHILVSTPLLAHARQCIIDKAPRKNERPSDHTPVLLELEME